MATPREQRLQQARAQKLSQACELLKSLGFGPRQSNQTAGFSLLACLNLEPLQSWSEATAPLRGITPIIGFIRDEYGIEYAPNTRETIRDEAVKYFVEAGLLIRNPDDPHRPTNSGKTVYQIEPHALSVIKSFDSVAWRRRLKDYLSNREVIQQELARNRKFARLPVTLPSGKRTSLSPGGQNPLIKSILEEFCPRWLPGGIIVYIGDAENKWLHLEADYLKDLGVELQSPEKAPDVIVHDVRRNWLALIEAVTTAGPVDGKRRKELQRIFSGASAGLIFVTAFSSRDAMRSFSPHIAWETEVWVASDPDHLIHFDGERFLGPYPDAMANP